ncbi:MAG TPA: helix-turn-helix transcriptional regulator [Solirubrobacteraceae bacterium]|nr:helix-turn-helix transcriptional regulator [Solirubrobacteraceae bacterium]
MGVAPPPSARHAELTDFLRTRRAQVSPESVGLQANGRRRTPGLRREEVAQLAGVGLSWYTWLEQGRDIHPSGSVLDAIARVLALDAAERAHLFHLARVELPLPEGDYPREASPELRAMVAGLTPHAAFVTGPRADMLAWNPPAVRLLRDFGAEPPERRNLLCWLFVDTSWDRSSRAWEETAKHTLARFRAQHARRPDDPSFTALIEELTAASPEFRAWWPRHEVVTDQAGTKTIERPGLGPLRLHHLQTTPTSDPELRLTIYVPADDRTSRALATLNR